MKDKRDNNQAIPPLERLVRFNQLFLERLGIHDIDGIDNALHEPVFAQAPLYNAVGIGNQREQDDHIQDRRMVRHDNLGPKPLQAFPVLHAEPPRPKDGDMGNGKLVGIMHGKPCKAAEPHLRKTGHHVKDGKEKCRKEEAAQPEAGKKFENDWAIPGGLVQIYYEEEGYRVIMEIDKEGAGSLREYVCYYHEDTDNLVSVSSSRTDYSFDPETGEKIYGDNVYEGFDGENQATEFSIDADGCLVWKDGREDAGAGLKFANIGLPVDCAGLHFRRRGSRFYVGNDFAAQRRRVAA